MEKREMNIPRQWEKRVLGKNSPYYAKRKSVYPVGNRNSDLERVIRNMSSEAKLSLLQPEIKKAKEDAANESLLGPTPLGSDEDSLPDDPWFSKSPEEKHADVIQEEHGQYEDGLFVTEDEGEDKLLNKLAREKYEVMQAPFNETPEMELGAGEFSYQDEGGSALDLMAEENWDPRIRGRAKGIYSSDDAQDKIDIEKEPSTWDSLKGLFASDSDSGSGTKSKGLSPMQKYGAKLITDIFSDDEQAPMQSIGASPLTPGRSFDMSYLKSHPKKERYRNRGLLGRA